jgi:hypothetical protein
MKSNKKGGPEPLPDPPSYAMKEGYYFFFFVAFFLAGFLAFFAMGLSL